MSICELCGEPMPEGEQMFKFHGYSGPCPKPPLPKPITTEQLDRLQFGKELHERPPVANRAQLAYETFLAGFNPPSTLPKWNDAPSWVRDVAQVAYLQGKLDGGPAAAPAPDAYRETVQKVAAAREKGYAAALANLKEAWAALAMIRETVETLAPSGSVKASEHLDGPTFMHEADTLVAGIMALVSRPPQAPIEKTGGSQS